MTRTLMLWLTGSTILFWILAAGLGAFVMREEFDEVFDSALQKTAERLMPLVVDDLFQRDNVDEPRRIAGGDDDDEYLTYQVRDANGAVLLHSHGARPEPFDAPLRRGFFDTAKHRIYTAEAVSGTIFLQVADNLDERREAMAEGLLSLLLPILLLAPLSMISIWYFVRRSLKPLGALRQEIGARDGGNLEPLAVNDLPVELQPINISVNRLLERLRTALEAEREFASNSAHELRTPIAGALAQTQRLIAELSPGPEQTRARTIEASLSALGHLTEKLLQLARADSGFGASAAPIDVVGVVQLVAEDFNRMSDYAGKLQLHLDGIPEDAPLVRRADADALGIILRNLVENAFLHGAPDRPVHVTISSKGTLTIANEGPVVPEPLLPQLTSRFKRNASAASGSGLGLAIVDRLARQMGATLTLASPARGRKDGFEAELHLPA
ncbi:ATP-binding protein [Mesorhizobium sp. IMUNJ 23232]|uniref:sensor histidine kinase n=1 Tax=Mesorhizobium sp. IMUNJ 23232 TaxID=3376064 RepID=UPI00379A36D6